MLAMAGDNVSFRCVLWPRTQLFSPSVPFCVCPGLLVTLICLPTLTRGAPQSRWWWKSLGSVLPGRARSLTSSKESAAPTSPLILWLPLVRKGVWGSTPQSLGPFTVGAPLSCYLEPLTRGPSLGFGPVQSPGGHGALCLPGPRASLPSLSFSLLLRVCWSFSSFGLEREGQSVMGSRCCVHLETIAMMLSEG